MALQGCCKSLNLKIFDGRWYHENWSILDIGCRYSGYGSFYVHCFIITVPCLAKLRRTTVWTAVTVLVYDRLRVNLLIQILLLLRYSVVRIAVLVPVPVYVGFKVELFIQILSNRDMPVPQCG
jgi:hypothetical protein